MTRFLKHVTGVILLVILLAYILDAVYTASFSSDFYRNKTQYAIKLKETHIDCDLITQLTSKTCLNLGLQGNKINDSAALLQILRDNEITYEKILFQLDYTVKFESYSAAFCSFVAPYVNDKSFNTRVKSEMDLPLSYRLPYFRYIKNDKLIGIREVFLQLIEKPGRLSMDNGFYGLQGVSETVHGKLQEKVDGNNSGVQWINDLEPNKLILYTSPFCKSISNRNKFMFELKSSYPEAINFIDLFDNSDGKFANCGHLNSDGAKEFTRVLTEKLLLN